MIDNFTVIVMWMPFTTPNRTLQNDCYPKGDFHQYSVRALSKKYERATCQIVPFDKGSSAVSGGDHGCVKDFLSDCFFSATTSLSCLRRTPWLFWLLLPPGGPDGHVLIGTVLIHNWVIMQRTNQPPCWRPYLIGEMRRKEKCSDLPVGLFPHISGSRCL